ncbi:MAG: hypothetical protein QOD48_1849, partial [Gaiellaceae bacterium]|nr:hypothetical protein [Gaiellaceae bacterium]
ERLDDMVRRRYVGIAAAQIDEWLAVKRSRGGNAREQRCEVLLRQAIESGGSRPHYAAERSARRSSNGTLKTTSS